MAVQEETRPEEQQVTGKSDGDSIVLPRKEVKEILGQLADVVVELDRLDRQLTERELAVGLAELAREGDAR